MSAPNMSRLRTVLQLVELKEFAKLNDLDYEDNETIYKWIDEGHAVKFNKHFERATTDIVLHCENKCGGHCKGDPFKCPLRHHLHRLMHDRKDW